MFMDNMFLNDKWTEYELNEFLPKEILNEQEKQLLEDVKKATNGKNYFVNQNGTLVCSSIDPS